MPRIKIANLPTRIHRLNNLTQDLGGSEIYIKREDETGLAFGGNKVRKLEFLMADALRKGAEVIITSGGAQSNHARLTAAAAVHCGLKPVLAVTDPEPELFQGNFLLKKLLGTEIHFVNVSEEDCMAEVVRKGEAKVKELKKYYEERGKKAYIVPRGGRSVQGTAAYVSATLEIYQQIIEQNLKIDYIVTAVGSTSTLGALILANKLYRTGLKPIGISVAHDVKECKRRIIEQVNIDKEYFGLDIKINQEDITVFDSYIGPGYAKPTKPGVEAIKLLAKKEAIFLDHNYTGKAMAGLIDLVENKYFTKDDGVLFLHTGGLPALFALDNEFL